MMTCSSDFGVVGVPFSSLEKGGRHRGARWMILLVSKLIHALPQGTILETELLSDVLLGSAFDKNGAERFKLRKSAFDQR